MIPLFGPGGNSEAFKRAGYRSSLDAPRFVKECRLDAYEYEAGQGIAGSPEMLDALGQTHWKHHRTLMGFAMDHGSHDIDGNCGSHGLYMPEDINIVHMYKAYGKEA